MINDEFGYNSKDFNYQIQEKKTRVNTLRRTVSRIEGTSIESELAKAKIEKLSDVTIRIPVTDDMGTNYLNNLNTEIIEKSTPSDSDRVLLQNLAKKADVPFSSINETQANTILQTLKGATSIIVASEKMNKNDRAWVRIYAKENLDIPYYEIADSGRLMTLDSNNELMKSTDTPVLSLNTALLAYTNKQSIKNKLNSWAEYTKELVENTEEHTEKIRGIRDNAADNLVNAEKSLANKFDNYFTYGPRQLQMLLKVSEENRSIVNILSINQGLANDDWNSFNYYNKFINRINKIVGTEFINKESLGKFINSVAGEDNGKFAAELTADYEKHKTALNPFFVLSENKHYFGYILSDMKASEVIRATTFTNETIERTLDFVSMPNQVNSITDDVYSDVKNFVYGLGVENFFNSNDQFSRFSLDNLSFDLTSNISRDNFVIKMSDVIRNYNDNYD